VNLAHGRIDGGEVFVVVPVELAVAIKAGLIPLVFFIQQGPCHAFLGELFPDSIPIRMGE